MTLPTASHSRCSGTDRDLANAAEEHVAAVTMLTAAPTTKSATNRGQFAATKGCLAAAEQEGRSGIAAPTLKVIKE